MKLKWSEEETIYLKENYENYSVKELSKKIKRTESAIRNKAHSLALDKRNKYDLTGKKSGKLTAVKPTIKRVNKKVMWECICDCGKKTLVSFSNFSGGLIISCGCMQGKHMKDISGKKFGRLEVVECTYEANDSGHLIWLCKCSCGTLKKIPSDSLIGGRIISCGCFQKEKARETLKKHYHTFILPTGKDHYRYNSNLTEEDRVKRRSFTKYPNWRRKIFERDGFTCQLCNLKKRNLNAHHLDGWNWAKEKRFDLENGVTLCVSCHKEFHNMYGRGNNTKEQFEEFMEIKNTNKII